MHSHMHNALIKLAYMPISSYTLVYDFNQLYIFCMSKNKKKTFTFDIFPSLTIQSFQHQQYYHQQRPNYVKSYYRTKRIEPVK